MRSLFSIFFPKPARGPSNLRFPKSAAPKTRRHKPRVSAHTGQRSHDQRHKEGITAYHGTPSVENAKSILRNGWAVGLGNAHGDGIYATTDLSVAKGYAGANGAVLKLAISGKVAVWSPGLQSQFSQWCVQQKCAADMSAKSAFLLDRGYRILRNGNVVVVLMRAYRNFMANKIRTRAIRVISITKASDGSEIPGSRFFAGRRR